MVWDQITYGCTEPEALEAWGGISYSLEALSVALPEGWVTVPILKLGEDLAEEALDYLRTLPRTDLEPGVRIAPHPNYRVQLRYEDQVREKEVLSGGVPPWTTEELDALDLHLDALYVNFITGFELSVETALWLRDRFAVPCFGDLHSLFQGISDEGRRFPLGLAGWQTWLRAFDAVQMNEDEFRLLGGTPGDPWELAKQVVGPRLQVIVVTMGSRGAAYVAGPGVRSDPRSRTVTGDRCTSDGHARKGQVPLEGAPLFGDTTGCGDVWGATFFASLLGGVSLEEAMEAANRLAAKNVEHRGARGLRNLFGDRASLPEEVPPANLEGEGPSGS